MDCDKRPLSGPHRRHGSGSREQEECGMQYPIAMGQREGAETAHSALAHQELGQPRHLQAA